MNRRAKRETREDALDEDVVNAHLAAELDCRRHARQACTHHDAAFASRSARVLEERERKSSAPGVVVPGVGRRVLGERLGLWHELVLLRV